MYLSRMYFSWYSMIILKGFERWGDASKNMEFHLGKMSILLINVNLTAGKSSLVEILQRMSAALYQRFHFIVESKSNSL